MAEDNQVVAPVCATEGEIRPVPAPGTPVTAEDEINLLELWRVLVGGWRLIALVTFLVLVLVIGVCLWMTPKYRAATLLAAADQGQSSSSAMGALASQFGGLAGLAGITLPSSGTIDTTLAIIASREFLVNFVKDRNLKQVLFADQWDPATKSWNPPGLRTKLKRLVQPVPAIVIAQEKLQPGEPSSWDAFATLTDDILLVSKDPTTGLVTLSVEWSDPEQAAIWANDLVQRANQVVRERVISDTAKKNDYLLKQISQTSLAALQTVLYQLIEENTKTLTLAKVTDDYALKVLSPAAPPQDVSKPKVLVFAALAFILGIFLGAAIVFGRYLWGNKKK